MAIIENILIVIGISVVLKPLFQILNSIYFHYKPQQDLIKKYGENSWAVVTGATDGIGFGFCQQLAMYGFNICLISRNKQKLQQKIQQLQRQCKKNIQYKYIVADFTKSSDPALFTRINKQLKQLDVSILINNVGISQIQYVSQQKIETIYDIINVNCYPILILTKMIVQKMKNRNRSSNGGIINISSYSSINPLPYMSAYAATKAFDDVFSQSFSKQCRQQKTNIDVLSVRAMKVISGAVKQKKGLTVPTALQCANDSIKYLGHTDTTAGHLKHQIISHITDSMPSFLFNSIAVSEARKVYQMYNLKRQKNK